MPFQVFSDSIQKNCDLTYSNRMKAIAEMNTLEKVKIVWTKHKSCIDGASAEAYSEEISKLLEKNWEIIVQSKELKDKGIINGLLFGISDVWEYNRSKKILNFAKNNCTPLAEKLCNAIIVSDSNSDKK